MADATQQLISRTRLCTCGCLPRLRYAWPEDKFSIWAECQCGRRASAISEDDASSPFDDLAILAVDNWNALLPRLN